MAEPSVLSRHGSPRRHYGLLGQDSRQIHLDYGLSNEKCYYDHWSQILVSRRGAGGSTRWSHRVVGSLYDTDLRHRWGGMVVGAIRSPTTSMCLRLWDLQEAHRSKLLAQFFSVPPWATLHRTTYPLSSLRYDSPYYRQLPPHVRSLASYSSIIMTTTSGTHLRPPRRRRSAVASTLLVLTAPQSMTAWSFQSWAPTSPYAMCRGSSRTPTFWRSWPIQRAYGTTTTMAAAATTIEVRSRGNDTQTMQPELVAAEAMARAAGLDFQIVAPPEDVADEEDDDMEEEQQEWLANSENTKKNTPKKLKVPAPSSFQPKASGIRVGSAGGWSLEVYPGDYVVHQKYGIGQFRATLVHAKTKLSPEEIAARDERRADILRTRLKEIHAEKGSVTMDDVNSIRSLFGTSQDTDPVSNPQTTELEIVYEDGIVHVPIDRAYRLSRYRSGDSGFKPRLSQIKNEQWIKATQKVEERTKEMAQEVLALYATRETLERPPFDPAKEVEVQKLAETFPYEPTVDQKKCFEDVETDMLWRGRPMDRVSGVTPSVLSCVELRIGVSYGRHILYLSADLW